MAFFLIVRNCARFGIVSGIGMILMTVGKAMIMTSSGLIGYIIIMNSDLKDKVYSPVFPVIVFVIIAYLIGSIFLSVYSFASTAILHCFIRDEEIHGNNHPECLNPFIEANSAYNDKREAKKAKNAKGKEEKQESNPKEEKQGAPDTGHADKKPNDMA